MDCQRASQRSSAVCRSCRPRWGETRAPPPPVYTTIVLYPYLALSLYPLKLLRLVDHALDISHRQRGELVHGGIRCLLVAFAAAIDVVTFGQRPDLDEAGKAGLSFVAMSPTVRPSEQLLTTHFEPPKVLMTGPTVQSIGAVCAPADNARQIATATKSILRRIKYSSSSWAYRSRIRPAPSIEECPPEAPGAR
jgi:hypothetical protein